MSKKNFKQECIEVIYDLMHSCYDELNLFCEIVGLPKSKNYFIGDDPHGVVDIMEGYYCFNMSDIHVVIAEYEHWLELYKTNEEIARVVREWYYNCQDWYEQHSLEESRWVSVKERLPKKNQRVLWGGYVEDLFIIKFGKVTEKGYIEVWNGDISPTHWKPIITPEQEAERSKGCPNLKSWLMGWRPDPKDVLPQYKEHQKKELTAAHARVEAAKEALEDAIKEEVKLNKF